MLDSAAASAVKEAAQNRKKTQDELRVEAAKETLLPLSRMLSLWDIEVRAKRIVPSFCPMPPSSGSGTQSPVIQSLGLLFFSSRRGAKYVYTSSRVPMPALIAWSANQENARAFARFYFHPRVMRPVSQCDPSTTILGFKSSIPIFVSGAALARLGHPLGTYSSYVSFPAHLLIRGGR